MNARKMDIVNELSRHTFVSQRLLAELTGYALGTVNQCMKELEEDGMIDSVGALTQKAREVLSQNKPQNAIILAAGYGMRMAPINTEVPKGLLQVHGEPLIERLICQLRGAGVSKICIVVGFMKEQYEYLIDKYDVQLITNPEYGIRNNLHSLKLVADLIKNTYILPCDIWCAENPFREHELYSWYMVSDQMNADSPIRINRRMELVRSRKKQPGNMMVGISYIHGDDAEELVRRLCEMVCDRRNDNAFWEDALYSGDKFLVFGKVINADSVVEINTYEQLRSLDKDSSRMKNGAIAAICHALNVPAEEIEEISVLKKGVSNLSVLFRCQNQRFILRIPDENSNDTINRRQEAAVYRAIGPAGIGDEVVYIDSKNGYKISKYLDNARSCNTGNITDVEKCMAHLRAFHEMGLAVEHTFDLFERVAFYESLWKGMPSVYGDYQTTKEQVFSLRPYIERHKAPYVLSHIDAVPDNFLFAECYSEPILIDWEYAAMQDPHVDIAMFCIYALYSREQVDRVIDLYFKERCSRENRIKIYCYIAVCGLVWSNWCEYMRNMGMEFGAYSLYQYRYAKEYYRLAYEEMNKEV